MDVAMGGRVAEELVFGADNITGGAGSDLESATKIARAMVTKFGMTEAVSATYCKLGRRWLFCCLEVSILPTTTDPVYAMQFHVRGHSSGMCHSMPVYNHLHAVKLSG